MHSLRLALTHLVVLVPLVGCAESHQRALRSDAGTVLVDASLVRDASSPVRDAGARGSCDPEDARAIVCPESVCDGPPSWHWNGDSCVAIDCGACEGTDCAGGPSRAACEAAHATCQPAICERTGGTWLWWAEECGHFECGLPPPVACLVGRPVCDCGTNRRFDPENGCVPADCPEVDPLPPDELCRSTGGEWGGFCCNSVCGERCGLACASPACHCPRVTDVFDAIRGCVPGNECLEREPGQRCHDRARCGGGTICCDRCGGPGCAGTPTCVAPTCDADPRTDTCGNDPLAP